MRTKRELRFWLDAEIQDVMDSYDNTEDEAREHIADMLSEGQDSYGDLDDADARIVLRMLGR